MRTGAELEVSDGNEGTWLLAVGDGMVLSGAADSVAPGNPSGLARVGGPARLGPRGAALGFVCAAGLAGRAAGVPRAVGAALGEPDWVRVEAETGAVDTGVSAAGRGVEAPGLSGSIGPGARWVELGVGSGSRKSLADWACAGIGGSQSRASASKNALRARAPAFPPVLIIKWSIIECSWPVARWGLNRK